MKKAKVNDPERAYRTPELGLASFLVFTKLPLLGIEASPNGRVEFVFPNSLECERLCREYWSGAARVEPEGFRQVYNRLRAAIRDVRRQGERS